MTKQPKRIWIDADHGKHPGDWSFSTEEHISAKDHRKIGRLPYVPENPSREREPVEPVAYLHSRDGGQSRELVLASRVNSDTARRRLESGWISTPLYTTPPDALALVAAAYRDAAGLPAFDCTGDPCGTFDGKVFVKLDAIRARTPADAQAALTAIERAAYERGVRDAANTYRAQQGRDDDEGFPSWDYFLSAEAAILALLTQEGQ